MNYRPVDCPNCNRRRVELDGVCEKCEWDVDANQYARVSRPEIYAEPEGGCTLGTEGGE